mgnify:FL=1
METGKVNFSHKSVLLPECIEGLNIKEDGIYIDGTAGGGGHSYAIASRLTKGRLIAIDRDDEAVKAAGERLAPLGERAVVRKSNYSDFADVCDALGVAKIDGILLDLGVSSYQLDTAERGFSYNADAPLDMRMDKSNPFRAYDVVNGYSEEKLKKILYEYGEERFAPRIAALIVAERERHPIETTGRGGKTVF